MVTEKEPKPGMEGEEGPAAEKIKIEKEIQPWQERERESEERFFKEYVKVEVPELNPETRESIDGSLKREEDERRIAFATRWIEEHEGELEEKGIPVKEMSEERKITIAWEEGAFEELRTNERYRGAYEELEHLALLGTELESGVISPEGLLLMLNVLENRARRIERGLEKLREEGREAEARIREEELARLFSARKELAETITGRDLGREAKERVTKEDIEREIEAVKGEIFGENWESLSPAEKRKYHDDITEYIKERLKKKRSYLGIEADETELLALIATGYDPEHFRHKIGVIEVAEGEEVPAEEFKKFVGQQKENFVSGLEARVRNRIIEGEIRRIAEFPEAAAGRIEALYQRIEDRLFVQFVEKELITGERSAEELERIREEFEREGEDPLRFLTEARALQREKLTGKIDKDLEVLSGLLERYGVEASPEELEGEIDPQEYNEVVGGERRFLEWLIRLIFSIFEGAAKEKSSK